MSSIVGMEDILVSIQATLGHIAKVERDIAFLTHKSSEVMVKEISASGKQISAEAFDENGNYSTGFRAHMSFPEISPDEEV